jgi:hypothetical protein
MPNKPVNHTDLDIAIKNSLLTNPAEAKVSWEEIDRLLPKKTNVVKGPLADLSFSMNSMAAVAASGSAAKIKSAMVFAKKWSVSLYTIAGSIVIITGAYFIYSSFSKNNSASPANTTLTPVTQEIIKQEQQPVSTSSTVLAKDPEVTTSDEAASTISENPNPEGARLLKKGAGNEKAASAIEPIQLKTEDPTEDPSYDFTTPMDKAIKPDTSNDAEQTGRAKKGKVLYYKESLSLDKLEQQISDNKPSVSDTTHNQTKESNGGLFRRLRKHSTTPSK